MYTIRENIAKLGEKDSCNINLFILKNLFIYKSLCAAESISESIMVLLSSSILANNDSSSIAHISNTLATLFSPMNLQSSVDLLGQGGNYFATILSIFVDLIYFNGDILASNTDLAYVLVHQIMAVLPLHQQKRCLIAFNRHHEALPPKTILSLFSRACQLVYLHNTKEICLNAEDHLCFTNLFAKSIQCILRERSTQTRNTCHEESGSSADKNRLREQKQAASVLLQSDHNNNAAPLQALMLSNASLLTSYLSGLIAQHTVVGS